MKKVLLDSDDAPIGRVLTRREVLALFGASGAALAVACVPSPATSPAPTSVPAQTAAISGATSSPAAAGTAPIATTGAAAAVPSCIVRPALTEGPFFVDEKLDRADIREAKPGILLALALNVSRLTGGQCRSLQGAVVDVWHCDAAGAYSDVEATTRGQKFLRGFQTTDASGIARFSTIYPGWYQGRAVHIHFKIRTTDASGRVSDFTSQLFFDERQNDEVFAQTPYSQRAGAGGRVRNESDSIFRSSDGKLTLTTARTSAGYSATFDIGLT